MRIALLILLFTSTASAQKVVAKPPCPSEAFFKKGVVPSLRILLAPEEEEKLRKEPRTYVPARMTENSALTFADVFVKLKGAAGSFREYDDRPAVTVRMNKVKKDQAFHGLAKFHLNNSVQDGSYLNELLSSEINNAAGIPTPRVTHARVFINDRDLGLYVLKEGFDKRFLARHFADTSGNLYDGGFCQDIDADLEKDSGGGDDQRSDLIRFREICAETDAKKRWAELDAAIDIPAFLTFMALERMTGHWDGYCVNRNNYRLYFDPVSRKARFFPHGMDQVFNDPEASILDHPTALLASAICKNPTWRKLFRKRVSELLPYFSPPDKLQKRVDEVANRLQPILRAFDAGAAAEHEAACRDLRTRLADRARSLREQSLAKDPAPIVFVGNSPFRPKAWRTASECEDARLSELKVGGEKVCRIETGPSAKCIASFRTNVLLAKGRYRFAGSVKVEGVTALPTEDSPGGASLRISGGRAPTHFTGSAFWKPAVFEFEVSEDSRDVELIIELRASKGVADFKTDSMKLTRLLD